MTDWQQRSASVTGRPSKGNDMASLTTMVKQLNGLVDTKDVSDWENEFLTNIMQRTREGDNTTVLTDKQIECVERIHQKHFSN